MKVKLDFTKRTLEIETPKLPIIEGKGSKAAVSWVVRQVKKMPDLNPILKIYWPRMREGKSLDFTMSEFLDAKGKMPIPHQAKKEALISFVVSAVIDMGANIKSFSKMVNTISGAVANFYDALLKELKVVEVAKRSPQKKTAARELSINLKKIETQIVSEVGTTPPKVEARSNPVSVFFRILPIRERRYLDGKYN